MSIVRAVTQGPLRAVILLTAALLSSCSKTSGETDLQAHHPNGSVLRLTSYQVDDDTVQITAVITNGFRRAVQLNGGKDCVVISDSGARYVLDPPPDNPSVSILPEQTIEATLRFKTAPGGKTGGKTFTLVTNERFGSADFEQSPRPTFRLQFPQAGAAGKLRALPASIAIDRQANHPNGTVCRLTRVEFGDQSTTASLACANGFSRTIKLNGNRDFVLIDNLGHRYPAASNVPDPAYTVAPAATGNLQVRFLGRVHPQATGLTLVTNEKFGSPDFDGSDRPQLRFQIPLGGAHS